jgi:hypothetical protein
MKSRYVRMAVAAWLVLGVGVAHAGTQKTTKTVKPAKPQVKTYTGTVKVTKDKTGQVTAAKLSAGGILPHTYTLALDTKGKELARKMDGKKVQVRGTLVKQKSGTRLTVREFNAVTPKPKPAKTTARK